MQTVKLRLRRVNFSREMVAMRRWLDHNRYEPARFDCQQNGDEIILSVAFTTDAPAKAFAQHFSADFAPSHRDNLRPPAAPELEP